MQVLAKRLLSHGSLQLGDQIRVAPYRELGLDPRLERSPTPLLQAGYFGLRKRLVGKIRKRWPPPQAERLPQCLGSALRVSPHLGQAPRHQLLKAVDIPLPGAEVQPVPAPMSLEPSVSTQRLPQRRHLVLNHLVRRRGRRLSPQLLHQAIARDQLVGAQEQQSQQGALSPRANRNREAAIIDGLQWAKQPEVHSWSNRNTASRLRKRQRCPVVSAGSRTGRVLSGKTEVWVERSAVLVPLGPEPGCCGGNPPRGAEIGTTNGTTATEKADSPPGERRAFE